MKEVSILIFISGLAFLIFLLTLILGFRKKNNQLKLTALFVFFVFIGLAGWTGLEVVSKTYNKIAGIYKPRTGDEIYDALFDKRTMDCVKILNYQDQVVPKIDFAIWLHLETCPKELNRILLKHDFKVDELSTDNRFGEIEFGETPEWFHPAGLGDTILIYEYSTNDRSNIQTIWSNTDSTEIFVRDILD